MHAPQRHMNNNTCLQSEEQKGVAQRAAAAKQALSRVHKVQADHEQRVAALEKAADKAEKTASVIEANLDAVNAAIAAINAQLATGMAWADVERLIEDERAKGAPVATMIAGVKFDEGRATLLLDDWAAAGGDAAKAPRLRVEIDLSVNAHTNAKCARSLCSAGSCHCTSVVPRQMQHVSMVRGPFGKGRVVLLRVRWVLVAYLAVKAPCMHNEMNPSVNAHVCYIAKFASIACSLASTTYSVHCARRMQTSIDQGRMALLLLSSKAGRVRAPNLPSGGTEVDLLCRMYYDEKKAALEKRGKTVAANSKVLKQVTAKTVQALAKSEATSAIREMRKVYWFEKFNWFITSEGYLVVSGRDLQQSELLVKRYASMIEAYRGSICPLKC